MPIEVVSTTPVRVRSSTRSSLFRWLAGAVVALTLAGCQADEEMSFGTGPKHLRQVSAETRAMMSELNMAKDSPVLMRIFKEDNTFEVWKKDRSGKYALLRSFEICKWSGVVGPKIKEGDRQAPEGYYTITPALMNPNSSYHLAFNTGYPNAFDRSHGRTGTHLMVHGACSSRGCYAMSDAQIEEIYALARDAFRGGQTGFQLAAYPFRMTPENMAKHVDSPHMPFWRMLKEGYDHFELTRLEPKVDVCGRKYVFNVTADSPLSPVEACPALTQPESLRIATARKAAEDDKKMIAIAAQLAEERRAAEEKAIALAEKEEELRRREEERRIALAEREAVIAERTAAIAERTQAFASIFGLASPPAADTADAAEPVDATAAIAAVETGAPFSPEGAPLPRRDPRGTTASPAVPDGSALAIAPESGGGTSMFSRLFTFGDDELPSPTADLPSETAAQAPAPTLGQDVATATPDISASPAQAALPPGIACDPAVAADGAGCSPRMAEVVAPTPASSAEDRSIMDRIGSWF